MRTPDKSADRGVRAAWRAQVHIISAACENMIDGKGMRPGDVLQAANGKTVEARPSGLLQCVCAGHGPPTARPWRRASPARCCLLYASYGLPTATAGARPSGLLLDLWAVHLRSANGKTMEARPLWPAAVRAGCAILPCML